ncbi:MAG: hypothetical protein ACERLG_07795 [Sedimentibacter sp.]
MILKEVRKEVEDKKGNKTRKLMFITLIEEDSLKISIKNKDYKESVLVDFNSIIGPYLDKATIKQVRAIYKSIYSQKKKEVQS